MNKLPPIALSMGDPCGIGPEIIAGAWRERKKHHLPPFYLIAPPGLLEHKGLKYLGMVKTVLLEDEGQIARASGIFDKALPLFPLRSGQDSNKGGNIADLEIKAGQPVAGNAQAIITSIKLAARHTMAGLASAMVTAPIAKHVLYEAGFEFPGHTEYLAELAGQYGDHGAKVPRPVMMLAAKGLRTIPLTIHVPLRKAPDLLSLELIMETARIASRDLRQRFGLKRPRLSVAGLNPHAGENGAMGDEEIRIIRPAIKQLQSEGIDISGPWPADTMFHQAARLRYDVALCPTHDQALIPVKTLGFDEGVNITLGLPFIRTSPDHGTAFDIAGQNKASPASLMAAIREAAAMARNQRKAHRD